MKRAIPPLFPGSILDGTDEDRLAYFRKKVIAHPSSPTIGYSVKNVVKYMNFPQSGVGGLLHELRQYSGDSPHIGFIQHIRTLPEIRLVA